MNQALSSLGWIVAASAIALILGLVVALDERAEPRRCGTGLVSLGPACCAPGQQWDNGECRGKPRDCPAHMRVSENGLGCVVNDGRVFSRGGRLTIGPTDWESEGIIRRQALEVAPFEIDAFEVTTARWQRCVHAKVCSKLVSPAAPGLPVTAVSPVEAARFCEFSGGRLPRGEEWIFAAAGTEGRRYPWGQAGLACRRAAWGLVSGPCARGAARPTLVGSRASGRTPEGVFDMSGNVAEWTREGENTFVARGGSYRSKIARQLKSWSKERASGTEPHVGFRCAYDLDSSETAAEQ
jgi:formylglycine-generating enzyme required for sulfatase activity